MEIIKIKRIIGKKRWVEIEVEKGSAEHKEIVQWNKAMHYQQWQDKKELERQNEIAENEISAEQMNEETGFELVDVDEPSPEDWYISKIEAEELRKAIQQLTPRQQQMLYLVYWQGKTQRDLCEIFDIKEQAVCDAMRRIYASLKKILEKNQFFCN